MSVRSLSYFDLSLREITYHGLPNFHDQTGSLGGLVRTMLLDKRPEEVPAVSNG